MHRKVERLLVALHERRSRPPKLSDRIRVLDESSQTVWLDGKELTIPHDVAFRVLTILIEAGEAGAAADAFRTDLICDGSKIDRVIREHLKPIVGDIIDSKRGNGAKRWLRLPPVCPQIDPYGPYCGIMTPCKLRVRHTRLQA